MFSLRFIGYEYEEDTTRRVNEEVVTVGVRPQDKKCSKGYKYHKVCKFLKMSKFLMGFKGMRFW